VTVDSAAPAADSQEQQHNGKNESHGRGRGPEDWKSGKVSAQRADSLWNATAMPQRPTAARIAVNRLVTGLFSWFEFWQRLYARFHFATRPRPTLPLSITARLIDTCVELNPPGHFWQRVRRPRVGRPGRFPAQNRSGNRQGDLRRARRRAAVHEVCHLRFAAAPCLPGVVRRHGLPGPPYPRPAYGFRHGRVRPWPGVFLGLSTKNTLAVRHK
jgi:hypothetical protein